MYIPAGTVLVNEKLLKNVWLLPAAYNCGLPEITCCDDKYLYEPKAGDVSL